MGSLRDRIIRQSLFLALLVFIGFGLLGYPVLVQPIGFAVVSIVIGFGIFWILYGLRSRMFFFLIMALVVLIFAVFVFNWIVPLGF